MENQAQERAPEEYVEPFERNNCPLVVFQNRAIVDAKSCHRIELIKAGAARALAYFPASELNQVLSEEVRLHNCDDKYVETNADEANEPMQLSVVGVGVASAEDQNSNEFIRKSTVGNYWDQQQQKTNSVPLQPICLHFY